MSLPDLLHWARSLWPLWLMLIFFGIVFHAYRPKNRRRFEDLANLPLRDDRPE